MEVGPLARYVIGYASGNPEFKEPVDMVLKELLPFLDPGDMVIDGSVSGQLGKLANELGI